MTKMRIKVPEFIAYNKRGIHNVLDSRMQWLVRALDVPIDPQNVDKLSLSQEERPETEKRTNGAATLRI